MRCNFNGIVRLRNESGLLGTLIRKYVRDAFAVAIVML